MSCLLRSDPAKRDVAGQGGERVDLLVFLGGCRRYSQAEGAQRGEMPQVREGGSVTLVIWVGGGGAAHPLARRLRLSRELAGEHAREARVQLGLAKLRRCRRGRRGGGGRGAAGDSSASTGRLLGRVMCGRC